MDITPLIPKGTQVIQGYRGGQFKVSGKTYQNPILVKYDIVIDIPFSLEDMTDLKKEINNLQGDIDVIVVGTGKQQAFPNGYPNDSFSAAMKPFGIGCEYMDTGAACRAYNVMVAEGRRVAVALMLYND